MKKKYLTFNKYYTQIGYSSSIERLSLHFQFELDPSALTKEQVNDVIKHLLEQGATKDALIRLYARWLNAVKQRRIRPLTAERNEMNTDEETIQKVWPGSYCYDSENYNSVKATRFKVTDGPGGRDCMDIAEGPTRLAAIARAAKKAKDFA